MLAYSLVSVEHQKADDLLTVLLGFAILWALASTVSFILAYRPSRIRNVRTPAAPTLRGFVDDTYLTPVVQVVPFDWAAVQERIRDNRERQAAEEAFYSTNWGMSGRRM